MNYALNNKGEMVDIESSIQGVSYTCPVCSDVLLRKVGKVRQYFAHKSNVENDCELKMSEMLKVKTMTKEEIELQLESSDFMEKVYANYLNDDKTLLAEDAKSIAEYAENGALHYAKHIITNTEYKRVNLQHNVYYLQ